MSVQGTISPILINTPPSYLENRTQYTQTPITVAEKKRKIQRVSEKVLPFSRERGDRSNSLDDLSAKSRVKEIKLEAEKGGGQGGGEQEKSECCSDAKCECVIF